VRMQFAHTLGEGGPEIELLIVGGAMLFLGIVFFIQKSVKPAVPVVLVIGSIAVVAGAFAAGGSDAPPLDIAGPAGDLSLEIASPEDGITVPARQEIELQVQLSGGELEEGGHFDVRVDDQLAAMTPELEPVVTLKPGEHTISVEAVNLQHQSFDPPVRDEITVTAE
jgi:hypothetical protein